MENNSKSKGVYINENVWFWDDGCHYCSRGRIGNLLWLVLSGVKKKLLTGVAWVSADEWLRKHASDTPVSSSWPEPWQCAVVEGEEKEIPSGLMNVDQPDEEEYRLPDMRPPEWDWGGEDLWLGIRLVCMWMLWWCLGGVTLRRVAGSQPLPGVCQNFKTTVIE